MSGRAGRQVSTTTHWDDDDVTGFDARALRRADGGEGLQAGEAPQQKAAPKKPKQQTEASGGGGAPDGRKNTKTRKYTLTNLGVRPNTGELARRLLKAWGNDPKTEGETPTMDQVVERALTLLLKEYDRRNVHVPSKAGKLRESKSEGD